MQKKRTQKKRTANDFLAMLSEIVVQEDDDENNENSNTTSKIETSGPRIDLTKDFPELKVEGKPILFNEWFNVCHKKFDLDKPDLKWYKNDFGLAFSTNKSIPSGPIELFKELSIPHNTELLSNDILAPSIFDYRDFLYIGNENPRFRKISALHVINHIYRDFEAKENRQSATVRDSNFTSTTVLVICPYKLQAYEFIEEIIQCLPSTVRIKKKEEEPVEISEVDQSKQTDSKKKHHKSKDTEYIETDFSIENYDRCSEYTVGSIPEHYLRTRPKDWLETFAGNTDSDFKTGIRFYQDKVSLFQEIAKSQLVIASPLALSLFEEKDFMSSIEVLVLDSIDVLAMQHADRLAQVIVGLNELPKTVTQTKDWSRVRQYCCDKNNRKMRQSIGYGRILSPEILNMYMKMFENIRGQLIVRPLKYEQILKQIDGAERTFKKMVISKSLSEQSINSKVELIGDVVFKTFSEKLFPLIKQWRSESEDVAKRTIIYFVSSYRFLQARKMLDDDFVNFLELSDESTDNDIKNMKRSFKSDQNAVLLLTERHYFHFRPKLNAGRVVFLQPPSYPLFAQELAGNCASTIYFTEFDEIALERVVGSEYCHTILSSDLYSY